MFSCWRRTASRRLFEAASGQKRVSRIYKSWSDTRNGVYYTQ